MNSPTSTGARRGWRIGIAISIAFGVVLGVVGKRFVSTGDGTRIAAAPPENAGDEAPMRHEIEVSDSARRIAPADALSSERIDVDSSPRSAARDSAGIATLAGQVFEGATGTPAAFVQVEAQEYRLRLTKTDEFGRFEIRDLPVGIDVVVTVRASETNLAWKKIALEAPGRHSCELRIEPRTRYSGTLVEKETGAAIADAVVSIGRDGTGSRRLEERTDSLGSFEFLLDDRAFRASTELIVRAAHHCAIRLDPRELTFPARIELLPAARIEGVVVDANGAPVSAFVESVSRRIPSELDAAHSDYADVRIDPEGLGDAYAHSTDTEGRFVLTDVAPYSRHVLRAFDFGNTAGVLVCEGTIECETGAPGSTTVARIVVGRRDCSLRVFVSTRSQGRSFPVDGARVVATQFEPTFIGASSRVVETSGFSEVTEIPGLSPGLATVRVEWPGRVSPPLERIELVPETISELRFEFADDPETSAFSRAVRVIDAVTGEDVRECSVEWRRIGTASWGAGVFRHASSWFGDCTEPEPYFAIEPPAGRIVVVARANDGTAREGSSIATIEPIAPALFEFDAPRPAPIVVPIARPEFGILRLELDPAVDSNAESRARRLFVRFGSGDAWVDRFDLVPQAQAASWREFRVPVGEYTVLSGPAESGEPDREHGRVIVGNAATATIRVSSTRLR